jgi:hypothetical protein
MTTKAAFERLARAWRRFATEVKAAFEAFMKMDF